MSKHSLKSTLTQSGMPDVENAKYSAMIVVATNEGLSIMAVEIDGDAEIKPVYMGKDADVRQAYANLLCIESAAAMAEYVQVTDQAGDARMVVLEEQEDGKLVDSVLKGIFKAPGTVQ